MTSIPKNLLLAFLLSLNAAFLGTFAKVVYELCLPVFLSPGAGIAASSFNLTSFFTLESGAFLIIFIILQWRGSKRSNNIK